MNAELMQERLSVTGSGVRDPEVVVAPAEPRNGRGIFVALSHAKFPFAPILLDRTEGGR